MKKQFLQLVFDFVDKYPQYEDGKLNYVFAGSIATNLLSLVHGYFIKCYQFDEKLEAKEPIIVHSLFKEYFRPITDIDIELYNDLVFKNISDEKLCINELNFNDYELCFREHIKEIYLDVLRSKSKIVYKIVIDNKSLWIEDFSISLGYRLKTLAKLSEDRFNVGHPKYEFTKNKYKYDLNILCKIYFEWLGKDDLQNIVEIGLSTFKDEIKDFPNLLHLNILVKRIKWLHLKQKYERFLLRTIENIKLKFYNNMFFNDNVFLLNEFYNVSFIEHIDLGKSKNVKYRIKINDQEYLLKSNKYLSRDNLLKTVKIVKKINEYMPLNSQHLEFYGYSDKLKESYISYKYINGKAISEFEKEDLFELGKKTGPILYKFHHIPVKGLSLKNENKFLNKVKKDSYRDNACFPDVELIKDIIKNNDATFKGIYLLHNDLNLGNIIYDGDKIIFIDFDNCSKGDFIIDFKKDIKNNNDFFDGLFIGYGMERRVYDYKLKLVLSLYEYYYMKDLPEDGIKKKYILERHEQFLDYFKKDTK